MSRRLHGSISIRDVKLIGQELKETHSRAYILSLERDTIGLSECECNYCTSTVGSWMHVKTGTKVVLLSMVAFGRETAEDCWCDVLVATGGQVE